VGENTQTAYALAIAFDLLPDSLVSSAAGRLAKDVEGREHHLTTAFSAPRTCCMCSTLRGTSGTHSPCSPSARTVVALPDHAGRDDDVERWDGIRPDSSFEDPGMNSFNHYAFGAVGDWMYQNIGGIDVTRRRPDTGAHASPTTGRRSHECERIPRDRLRDIELCVEA